MSNRAKLIAAIVCITYATLNLSTSYAQESSAAIPYQGTILDLDNGPLKTSNQVHLIFRIYSAPVGGMAQWTETHESVSVVNGNFSVLLGTLIPFPTPSLFRRTVYLGVTLDDGDPSTAAVEMRPRQAIVPIISSSFSKESERAETADLAIRAYSANRADSEIPVGGITIFYGDEEMLPNNWRICNGQRIEEPRSPFYGKLLPNLQGRFVKGLEDREGYVDSLGFRKGTGGTKSLPQHSHSYTVGFGVAISKTLSDADYVQHRGGFQKTDVYSVGYDPSNTRSHSHVGSALISGTTSPNEISRHSPLYMALHYIIRIW